MFELAFPLFRGCFLAFRQDQLGSQISQTLIATDALQVLIQVVVHHIQQVTVTRQSLRLVSWHFKYAHHIPQTEVAGLAVRIAPELVTPGVPTGGGDQPVLLEVAQNRFQVTGGHTQECRQLFDTHRLARRVSGNDGRHIHGFHCFFGKHG